MERRIARHVANLSSENESRAVLAERCLIRYGERAVEPLMAATRDARPEVRFRAIYALGQIRDLRAYDTIVHCAQDEDPRVAQEAVAALSELTADPGAEPPLLGFIEEAKREEQGAGA